jgi:hypothetical protein
VYNIDREMSFIFLLRYFFFLFCFVLLVLKGAPTGAAGWVSAQVTNEIKNEKKDRLCRYRRPV